MLFAPSPPCLVARRGGLKRIPRSRSFTPKTGEVFAIDDTCTHQDASLADGWVEGCEVECPLHASKFDLRTGAVDEPPAKLGVRTHEVVITDDVINVVLNTAPPNLPPGVTARAPQGGSVRSVAVVGASLAGLSAARALRRQGFDGELTIVGAEARRPYDRPPLSKEFLAGDICESDLALEGDDDNIDARWLLGVHATRLDTGGGAIALDDGTEVHADGVVVATGARARAWQGTERLAGVHVLRTIDDALALREDLRPGSRLVVIGAGFIGAEVASTATKLGLDVTVVELARTPLAASLGEELGAAVARLHAKHGTRLVCGAKVSGLTGAERVTGVEIADGRHLAADVVVVGVGAIPNIEWLNGSGLELANGVVCDGGGATSIPNVVAVGDCAAWYEHCGGRGAPGRALDRCM